MDPSPRGKESTALEQAVSRAVRDNLPLVQHTAKELGQAIEDFVAACGSTRNANMLPAMLRAQTAAASLTSMLDVLARLLTASLQPGRAGASEAYVALLPTAEAPAAEPVAPVAPTAPPRAVPQGFVAPEPVAAPAAPPPPQPPVAHIPEPEPEPVSAAPPPVVEPPPLPPPPPFVEEPVAEAVRGPLVPPELEPEPAPVHEFAPSAGAGGPLVPPEPAIAAPPAPAPEPAVAVAAPPAVFRVEDLPPEQQELHRRANRHAKVSMQDIYLLRPKDVKLARENKDICVRLRGDIDKARKEYVRRFGPILEHPVDYFYHWMVEVLAEGKPETLGEYPYPSAATRR